MLPNAGDRLVTIEFDDLCSRDPSLRSNLLQTLEKVSLLECSIQSTQCEKCRSLYHAEAMLHAGRALGM